MSKTLKSVLIGAWAMFLLCLVLPPYYDADAKSPQLGWELGLLAVYSITLCCENWASVTSAWLGCANLAMLLLPCSLRIRSLVFDLGLFALLLVASVLAIQFFFRGGRWDAGYYLWLASFILAGAVFAVHVSRSRSWPDSVAKLLRHRPE